MTPYGSPRRTVPLVVLAIVAAVPAAVSASLWRLAEARLPTADELVVVPTVPAFGAAPVEPLPTPLLSYRRQPVLIARRVEASRVDEELARRVESLSSELGDRLAGSPGATGCLRVEIGGDLVADVGTGLRVVPASTQKLLIAAVAIDVLGPDFRYRTEVRSMPPLAGVVTGDVVLVGGGDPVLVSDGFVDPQRHPAFNTTSLDRLADQIVAAGVTVIDGAVGGAGARYDDESRAPSWGPGITNFDAGPYDALLVDDGFLSDGNHGIVPARSAAARFVDLLRERGVTVRDGAANQDRAPLEGETVLAVVESAPLSDILVEMLHTSDNNTAEMVLKEIGATARGIGAREVGLDVVRARLTDWAIDAADLVLADGSGLSRVNQIGCDALTAVLGSVPVSSALVDLLPAAGRDGTLSTRLLGTPAEGRLRGKTGTLTGVKALAGEQPDREGRPVVFAVVMNGDGVEDPSVHEPVWNEIVRFIDDLPISVDLDADEFGPGRSATGS
ncbi:MAG: D-alanyl-D-alanine carboxypeptidase/D-alanyl-D-alanine endopeptidase [Ilumatobacteraceae bacterium]